MDDQCCSSCHMVLKQPYVNCKTCKTSSRICLDCFSKGREFGKHKKSHRYSLVNENLSILEEGWTANDELKLLDSLLQKGEGNWDEISKFIGSKNPKECQIHYEKFYLENDPDHIFPKAGKSKSQPVIFAPLEEASGILRPAQRSNLHKDLAGYNAARADFDWESDNLAEMELNYLEANDDLYRLMAFEDHNFENNDDYLMAAMSSVALQVHNSRLKKRLKRKKIVREYGLLNKARDLGLTSRYPVISGAGTKYQHIFKMGRTLCALDFDFILEGIEHEMQTRQHILRLQEYRNNGLRKTLAAAFYTKLKGQRERDLMDRPRETVLDYVRSAKIRHVRSNPLMTMTTRRSAGPLDIVGMPSYEKLSEDERDLCSESRVFPEVFMEVKKVLEEECQKSNGLRLADARPLVKIDVNKTRKIYDFLLKKELIRPPQK